MHLQIDRAVSDIGEILLGKERQIRLALCCLLAGGHLLLEDLPGMGKTTLAQALSMALGLRFSRVQFTSDLLPADILGSAIFDRDTGEFVFHPGPIFTQVLLADEINRATPRTQSALLEAMAEAQVSIEGKTRQLPRPFFVIATQNPAYQSGTYPLPESQLDRFMMRLSLGYPSAAAERQLLLRVEDTASMVMETRIDPEQLFAIRGKSLTVKTAESLIAYVQRLVAFTRESTEFAVGLSPRGALALMAAARTWALMEGRDFVIPEDVQAVLGPVIAHRLVPSADYAGNGDALVALMLRHVDIVAQ